MAEAKKPAKKAEKSAKAPKEVKKAELVVETAPVPSDETNTKKESRAAGSEGLQGEAAERNDAYSNTESEHSKASTPQGPESVSSVGGSAVEQANTARSSGVAKAGKRSAKAVKEAEAKQAKAERKTVAGEKPKIPQKPPRSRAERAGKKYREVAKLVEVGKEYPLSEALDLATKTSTTKFDGTVEMHLNLGVDPKQADENVRGTVTLPAGTGKTVRIAVFAEADDAAKAKKAGADIAGSDEIVAELDKENINFDVLIATPKMMPSLGKYARLLGPRGLMPNPKSGTVATDVASAVAEAKAGKVEYRVDPAGIIHLAIGKVSFGPVKLAQNAEVILASIRQAKPASLKGIYIKSISVSTTMGPGIKVKPS